MSDELRTHAEILTNLREPRSPRQDEGSDLIAEAEASDSYAARFTELLSIFMPDEESAAKLAHH